MSAVFGNCIDKLAMLRHYDVIVDLMKNIEATGMMPDKARDDLLLQVIRKITEQGGQVNKSITLLTLGNVCTVL